MNRPKIDILLVLGLMSFGLASCEIFQTKDYSAEANELAIEKSQWERAGYSDYSFNYTKQGLTPDNGVLYSIQVTKNSISSVLNTSTNNPVPSSSLASFPTVADLFGFVQDGIKRKAYKLDISYDPVQHFPTSIYIDYSQDTQDEELSLKADSLQAKQ